MAGTKIEWTEMTWNPSTGCTKISPGCYHCYAEKMTYRLQAMGMKKYRDGFKLQLHEEELLLPYTWKKPRTIFVNSMSDLFHEDIPLEFIQKVFRVMNENRRHTFQVLTKRADILSQFSPLLTWTPNIWMGVTIENAQVVERINSLRSSSAFIKFLSLEPLLTSIPKINLHEIDWVIVGGESGPNSRPIQTEWVLDIKDQCDKSGIPFFFKQWGGKNKKATGSLLNGSYYKQMPKSHPHSYTIEYRASSIF
jgi:protein gp37